MLVLRRVLILAAVAACGQPTGSTIDAPGDNGDTYLPWEGGPGYYGMWSNGPSTDPSSFPIAVWLQSPARAPAYKAIGIDLFIGLYGGPTEQQLGDLTTAGVPVIPDQAGVYAAHLADKTIESWRIPDDEPDNAQPDGMGGYGPCIDPSVIVGDYNSIRAKDPTRPVYLNLGQGVAYDDYIGRGSACAGKLDMYRQYELGADIVAYDIYPMNNTDTTTGGNLWFVAQGVDRLRMWSDYKKPVWNWIETTGFNGPAHAPTPSHVRTEVWMSLIHGAMGIGYFCHVFAPQFIEAGLLADQPMATAVGAIDQQIHDLAPVLNSRPIGNAATVMSSTATPIDILVKRYDGALYVFAVAMRPAPTQGTFTLRDTSSTHIEVLGEERQLTADGGSFTDAFDGYAVHLYKIR